MEDDPHHLSHPLVQMKLDINTGFVNLHILGKGNLKWLSANMGLGMLVSLLVFWAKSTTKGYIMAKNNVQSISYLLCTQVIKPQIIHKPQNQSWHKFT